MRSRTAAVLFLVLLLTILAACGEDGRYGATFINQGIHEIDSGQTMVGELYVAGGEVTIQADAHVNGSIYVLGGTVVIDGSIDGDVAALGGAVELTDRALIAGDLYTAGSDLTRAPGADVRGGVTEVDGSGLGVADASRSTTLAGWLAGTLVAIVGFSLLAGLIVQLMPRMTGRVAETAVSYPLMSGSLGILLLLVLPILLVFMAFTIVLIPFAILGVILLGIAGFYGAVGLARGAGEAVSRRAGRTFTPTIQVIAGMALLVVITSLISLIPFVAEITFALLGALTLGAVVLSGFGLRSYRPPNLDVAGEADDQPASMSQPVQR